MKPVTKFTTTPPRDVTTARTPFRITGSIGNVVTIMPMADEDEARAWDEITTAKAA